MATSKRLIIADIDGCCIDSLDRIPLIKNDDFTAYHKAWRTDKPIPQGVAIYRMFLDNPQQYKVLFITSREELAREYTLKQLQAWVRTSITDDQLLMRPTGVYSKELPDTVLKPMLLKEAGYSTKDVFLVFEDRNSMVKVWRDVYGVMVYQTAEGDW